MSPSKGRGGRCRAPGPADGGPIRELHDHGNTRDRPEGRGRETAPVRPARRSPAARRCGADFQLDTDSLRASGRADQALAAMQRNRHPAQTCLESASRLSPARLTAAHGRTSQAQEIARNTADFARAGQHGREVMCLQAAIQFGDQDTAVRVAELAGLADSPRAGLVAVWPLTLSVHHRGPLPLTCRPTTTSPSTSARFSGLTSGFERNDWSAGFEG